MTLYLQHNFFIIGCFHQQGLGTDDDTLIRVVVTHCEVDMVQIKQEFQRLYGKTLESYIQASKANFSDVE